MRLKKIIYKIITILLILIIILYNLVPLLVFAIEDNGEKENIEAQNEENEEETGETETLEQNIKINDEKLYLAIIEQIENSEEIIEFTKNDIQKTIKITESELEKIKKLKLNNRNLLDLTGLEKFIFLEELNISNNNITSIEQLSQLINLKKLEAFGNTISDIGPITNITSLEYLNISKNNLKDLNSDDTITSKICNLINLTYLDLSHNYLKYTNGLNKLINLKDLNLYDNMIKKLDGIYGFDEEKPELCGFKNLRVLNLGQNNEFNNSYISGIANLDTLATLKRLDFSQNNNKWIVNYIKKLKDIEYLNLEGNQITTLIGKGFEDLTGLKEINLYNNSVTDISPLFSIESLEKVIAQKNNIESLEGILNENNELVWKNLKYLDIAFNSINTDLEINRKILNILCNKSNDKTLALNYENITDITQLPHYDSNGNAYVTYEDFGARCDGIYDDFIAIRNAHTFANENNCEVRGTENKEYHIFKYYEDPVEINTNVNWNNSKIIIHDEEIENYSGRYKDIFIINNMKDSVKIENPAWTINKTTKKIDISNLNISGFEKYYCIAINNEKKQFIRTGELNANSGKEQQDYFLIDNEGNVLNDIQWDFDKLTSIEFYGIPSSEIIIQNVNILTNSLNSKSEASYRKNSPKDEYFARGIHLNCASNIKISGLNHTISNDELSGSYRGIIVAEYCTNLEITDCKLFTRKYSITGRSTYDLTLYEVVDSNLKNIESNDILDEERWGITGTSYSKDIVFENCTLNRIDSHAGIYNLDILNCNVGCRGLTLIGQGNLNIINTKVTSKAFIVLRTDYGSTWDGNVNIKDCIFKDITNSKESKFIQIDVVREIAKDDNGNVIYDENGKEIYRVHDFGYDLKFPNIYAENLTIDISDNDKFEDMVIFPIKTQEKLEIIPSSYWPENIFINGCNYIRNNDNQNPYIKFFLKYPDSFENIDENYFITDSKLKLDNKDGEDITRKFNLNEELNTSENVYFEIHKNNSANNYLSISKDNQKILDDILIDDLYNYTFTKNGKYQIKIKSKPIIYSENQDGTIVKTEDDKISGEKIYEFEIEGKFEVDSEEYNIIQKNEKLYICNIEPKTTLEEMKSNIETNGIINVYMNDEEITEDTIKICTGMKVVIAFNEELYEFAIVVRGDANNDGEADIKDILRVNKHRLNKITLEDENLLAGDVNDDGIADIKDILRINKYRLGKIENL